MLYCVGDQSKWAEEKIFAACAGRDGFAAKLALFTWEQRHGNRDILLHLDEEGRPPLALACAHVDSNTSLVRWLLTQRECLDTINAPCNALAHLNKESASYDSLSLRLRALGAINDASPAAEDALRMCVEQCACCSFRFVCGFSRRFPHRQHICKQQRGRMPAKLGRGSSDHRKW